MLLSVVIPAFNEAKILADTLGRIKCALEDNRDQGFEWEIIVCDNHSTDETSAVSRENGALVVCEPVNQISRARNTGAGIARGQWLLFIDADTYPTTALIRETIDTIRAGNIIGCSATVKVKGGPFLFRFRVESHNLEMRLMKNGVGAFLLCDANAFRAIEGFSHDLSALEEIDFIKRLKAYGHANGKSFTVLHRHPVVTSGRKGNLYSNFDISKSICLALWSLVCQRKIRSPKSLPYWYDGRR
ncbi:MAG: glycosyltransferase [Verrucomicrobiota bacterium]